MSEWINVNDRLPNKEKDNDYYKEYLVVCRTKGGVLPEGYFQSVHKARYHFPFEPDKELTGMGFIDMGYTAYWELLEDIGMDMPFDVVYWMEISEVKE